MFQLQIFARNVTSMTKRANCRVPRTQTDENEKLSRSKKSDNDEATINELMMPNETSNEFCN